MKSQNLLEVDYMDRAQLIALFIIFIMVGSAVAAALLYVI